MPEGPQVYQTARYLRELLLPVQSSIILETMITYTKGDGDVMLDIHSPVTRIITKGKRAVIGLEDSRGVLLIFALSGELKFSDVRPVITESTVALLIFSNSVYITLNDIQHLAMAILDTVSTIVKTMLAKGFDPMHTITGMRKWISICRSHPAHLVATFITNQDIIAGIGNRYRSEIMHIACIKPTAHIRDLSDKQLQILLITIYRVLKAAARGEYKFLVYGKKETPDGKPVKRVEVAKGVLVWTTIGVYDSL